MSALLRPLDRAASFLAKPSVAPALAIALLAAWIVRLLLLNRIPVSAHADEVAMAEIAARLAAGAHLLDTQYHTLAQLWHQPFSYRLFGWIAALFGSSPEIARGFTVGLALLNIPLWCFAARLLYTDRQRRWLAVALFGLAAHALSIVQLRAYAVHFLSGTAIFTIALWVIVTRSRAQAWLGAAVLAGVGSIALYNHLFGLMGPATVGIAGVLLLLRRQRRAAVLLGASGIVVLLVNLPQLRWLVDVHVTATGSLGISSETNRSVESELTRALIGNLVQIILWAVLFLCWRARMPRWLLAALCLPALQAHLSSFLYPAAAVENGRSWVPERAGLYFVGWFSFLAPRLGYPQSFDNYLDPFAPPAFLLIPWLLMSERAWVKRAGAFVVIVATLRLALSLTGFVMGGDPRY